MFVSPATADSERPCCSPQRHRSQRHKKLKVRAKVRLELAALPEQSKVLASAVSPDRLKCCGLARWNLREPELASAEGCASRSRSRSCCAHYSLPALLLHARYRDPTHPETRTGQSYRSLLLCLYLVCSKQHQLNETHFARSSFGICITLETGGL